METPAGWNRLEAALAAHDLTRTRVLYRFLVEHELLAAGEDVATGFSRVVSEVLDAGPITGPSEPARIAARLVREGWAGPAAATPDPEGAWAREAFWEFRRPLLDGLRERMREVCVRHLPEGARSPHQVLYDFDGEVSAVPTAPELAACLADYLVLIEEAFELGPEEARGMLMASELALGLLGRYHGTGGALPRTLAIPRLRELLPRVVADARRLHPHPETLDGYKRLGAMVRLLEGWEAG